MLLLVNGEKPLLENRYFMIQGNKAFFFIIPKNMKLVSNIHICMYLYFKKKSIRRKMKDTCVIAFSNFLFPYKSIFVFFAFKEEEASKLPSSLQWWSIIPIPSSMMYKFLSFWPIVTIRRFIYSYKTSSSNMSADDSKVIVLE